MGGRQDDLERDQSRARGDGADSPCGLSGRGENLCIIANRTSNHIRLRTRNRRQKRSYPLIEIAWIRRSRQDGGCRCESKCDIDVAIGAFPHRHYRPLHIGAYAHIQVGAMSYVIVPAQITRLLTR
jgi:hypothetical protein